jgi:signal transduction histidine kinase
MLEFVRPIRLQVEQTRVDEVLHQAITLAEAKVPRGDISLTVALQPDMTPIDGDHHQLCQVFTNLLINAFEALDGQGHIDIRAVEDSEEQDPVSAGGPRLATRVVVIDVVDNGPGVPAHLNDRIFLPFFTTKPKGSGLGLPIVRKIIDAHEGRLDLTSAPGSGTRFRVTLPVAAGGSSVH